jgi:peptidoglycan hydrolase-like protein with peptidoglycan-binding domain
VQRALAAAQISVEQDGIYGPSTAAAVALFQKRQGINLSGVVDPMTRRLGTLPEGPRPGGRN